MKWEGSRQGRHSSQRQNANAEHQVPKENSKIKAKIVQSIEQKQGDRICEGKGKDTEGQSRLSGKTTEKMSREEQVGRWKKRASPQWKGLDEHQHTWTHPGDSPSGRRDPERFQRGNRNY